MNKVTENVENILSTAKKFDAWVSEYSSERQGKYSLSSDVGDKISYWCRELRNIKTGYDTPTSVAIYGASQSGKSLFVGRLLETNEENILGLDESATQKIDFLTDLNPRDAVEATAVVTRFTLGDNLKKIGLKHEHPVQAKILTRTDILKSLARGFKSECRVSREIDREFVEQLLKQLSGQYEAETSDVEWRLDICEAHKFLYTDYQDASIKLTENELIVLLRKYPLTPAGYLRFSCEFFWESWQELNDLFSDLLDLHEKLSSDADIIALSWDVIPYILNSRAPLSRVQSPNLEASNWEDFGHSDNNGIITISRDGRKIDLRLLQGLICELIIPLQKTKLKGLVLKLFERTDVLDIPGAVQDAGRSRMNRSQFEEKINRDDKPELNILKRGRVGYLFEKYAEEKQLSTLLYMQKWGPFQAISEINPQLMKWGKATNGNSWPSDASHLKHKNLKIIMTQIDGPGFWSEEPDGSKFDAVLRQELVPNLSFMNDYGGANFDDLFILRHPGKTDKVSAFSDKNLANGWADAFKNTSIVKQFVAKPNEKWDEAFSSDGGLNYLLENVMNSINPSLHHERLNESFVTISNGLKQLIKSFHYDIEGSQEIEDITEMVNVLISWLRSDNDGYRAKRFIDALHCDEILITAALEETNIVDSNSRRSLTPVDIEYEKVVTAVLNKWEASRDWETVIQSCEDDINICISLNSYTSYLKQLLIKKYAKEISILLEGIHTTVITEVPREKRFELYAGMIFDDMILTPGPKSNNHQISEEIENKYSFADKLVEEYNEKLIGILLSCLDDEIVNPPAGNDELSGLLLELN